MELPAHLLHHLLRRAAHREHREPAEGKGHHGAEEERHQHHRVQQGHVVEGHELQQARVRRRHRQPVAEGECLGARRDQINPDHLDVGRDQRQRRQRRGADGEALAGGRGGVAERVQRIGARAHLRAEPGHLGVAAGVIGNGAVGVGRERDAERREHADGRDGDTVEPLAHVRHIEARREQKREQRPHHHRNHRRHRRQHADADASDDGGGRTALRSARNGAGRPVGRGGEVLRGAADQDARDEPRHHRAPDAEHVVEPEQPQERQRDDDDERGAGVDAAGQGAEQLALIRALARLHQIHAEHRQQNAEPGDGERRDDGLELQRRLGHVGRGAERAGGEDRPAVGLEQVRAHARHVADVVAHVVRDDGRVARVVLRNAGLNLADEVRAHVRRLRIDAAADPREQRLQRRPHAEGQHRGGHQHHAAAVGGVAGGVEVDEHKPEHDVREPEPHHHEPHHRTAAKSDLQRLAEGALRRRGGARGGAGRGLHAEVAGERREEPAEDKGHGQPGVLDAEPVGEVRKEPRHHREHQQHDLVLLAQIGHGAGAHMAADGAHLVVALILRLHLAEEAPREHHGDEGGEGGDPEHGLGHDIGTADVVGPVDADGATGLHGHRPAPRPAAGQSSVSGGRLDRAA